MKIFWTSIFWIVVFFLAVFYVKTFDDTMGTKVASWLSSTAVVTGEVASGEQNLVLSGLVNIQTTLDAMTQKVEDIATKVGVTNVVLPTATGTVTPAKAK